MVRAHRKTIIVTFVATLLIHCLYAHAQEAFLHANELYSRGEYKKAIHLYESISPKGAGVYLNLGNAYYHHEDLVSALVQWKKAQRLARGALLHTILKQIALAEQQLQIPSSPYMSLLVNIGPSIAYVPMIALQLLWCLLMIFLLLSVIKKTSSRRVFNVIVLLFACTVVSGVMAMKHMLQLPSCALVHTAQAPLFAGPNNHYHTVGTLPAGSQVSICQQGESWYKIACGNNVGWIESSALVVV